MTEYIAETVAGDLPVTLVTDYVRPVVTGLHISYIGIVVIPFKGIRMHRVIFFDMDGTTFWASNGVDEYVKTVRPSYMPRSNVLVQQGLTRL